ncbi:hypothetical protein DFH09DRAFT_1096792 [Mycena vulgaris]|nr:hypothetical protein DFH09DRAFT_1096792 [Mycena vulgaris]
MLLYSKAVLINYLFGLAFRCCVGLGLCATALLRGRRGGSPESSVSPLPPPSQFLTDDTVPVDKPLAFCPGFDSESVRVRFLARSRIRDGGGGGWNHERGDTRRVGASSGEDGAEGDGLSGWMISLVSDFGAGRHCKEMEAAGSHDIRTHECTVHDHPAVEDIVGVLQERILRKAGHLRTSRPYKIYVDFQRNPVGKEHADIPKDASMKSFTSPQHSAISEFTPRKTFAINRDTTKSMRIIDLTVAERFQVLTWSAPFEHRSNGEHGSNEKLFKQSDFRWASTVRTLFIQP